MNICICAWLTSASREEVHTGNEPKDFCEHGTALSIIEALLCSLNDDSIFDEKRACDELRESGEVGEALFDIEAPDDVVHT